MGRLKMYAGLGIFIQAIMFLSILLFNSSPKRKKALLFGMLAACFGTLGTYLVLNGAKESAPTLGIDDPEEIFGVDEAQEIQCHILSDDELECTQQG